MFLSPYSFPVRSTFLRCSGLLHQLIRCYRALVDATLLFDLIDARDKNGCGVFVSLWACVCM